MTRSVLAAELIAFVDLFDQAFAMASDLGKFTSKEKLPKTLLTDSKTLFDILTKGSRTSEMLLMLDVAATREGYRNGAISNIGFVRTEENIADVLTKKMSTSALRAVFFYISMGCESEPVGHSYPSRIATTQMREDVLGMCKKRI